MLERRFVRLMSAAALTLVLALPTTALSTAAAAQDGGEDAASSPFDPQHIGSFAGAFLAARTADFDRDTDAAIAFYKRGLAFEPDNNEIKQRLMLAYITEGRFKEGLALAEELKDDSSIERVTDLTRAVEAIRKREYRAVEQLLDYDGPNELDSLMTGLVQAWARFGSGDADEALAMIDELQGPDWYSIFLNFHGGAIAAAAGDREQARQRYTAVITDQAGGGAAPDTYMRAVMALAALEARAGNQQAALDAISTGDAFSSGYAPLMALRQSIENGEKPEIDISSASGGVAAVLHTIAAALNREGAEEVVSLYLHLSLVLDPENAATLILLAGLAENLDKPEQAIDIYESVPEASPMRRVAQLQLGLNLADLDRTEEAKAHLKALIEADPDDMRSYLAYGSVLSNAKQYEEMAANYDTAVEKIGPTPNRSHWNIFFQRGIAYERLKEWETAEPNFLKALDLFPDQPQVLNYLGYSWVDMNMNLDEGMDMIEQAVELRPNDGYIVDSLGWAHYRLGDYEQAVSELERAVELRPADATINDHLGDAYWRVGRKLEATFQWNRALTLEPEDDQIPLIRAKIEDGLDAEGQPATAEERQNDRPPAASPDERSDLKTPDDRFGGLALNQTQP
ncbi:tetratricopeptide repeat protein [Pararhizobium haloflavum]|uniref:tetratricopeptide repeat protein n=1 Tax=Pararhizobium haloflavum TaxID=2037914 RepID=UPI000C17F447|nr:tetratricopeptide repeat protein [Pararhizobium haloflavum]